jgi:D-glycero-alpha-D-manno-heptose 1-phosphate guanylyltransferase
MHRTTLSRFSVTGHTVRLNSEPIVRANEPAAFHWDMMKKLKANREIPSDAVSAFVLCGGQGTRLRPVLSDRPKSMALISGTPFLQLLLERLRSQKVENVILGTGYMADQIEGYFGSGKKFGVRIGYSREYEPLGTGGALKLAEPLISDPALVLNGDSYVDCDVVPMLEMFKAKEADLVIVVHPVADVARYGSVALDEEGRVTQFTEKGAATGPGLINAGVYLLRKQIVRGLPSERAISLEREIFPRLLDRRIYGLISTGLFIDIGIPEDLERAQTLLA